MRITKIHFGHCVGKYAPSTELPRDFCAGIGPLQLGVVLVVTIIESQTTKKQTNHILTRTHAIVGSPVKTKTGTYR